MLRVPPDDSEAMVDRCVQPRTVDVPVRVVRNGDEALDGRTPG
jgi:hypothetical protein